MTDEMYIKKTLAYLPADLVEEILRTSVIKEIPKDTEILREGQFVKVIPIVLDGLIKVFSRFNEKELLLYYIKPEESCVMSFAASIRNEPSKVFALTEEDTKVLLLPVSSMGLWLVQYPDLNKLFYQQYNLRYSELLDTINHVLFNKMDIRLYSYLEDKVKATQKNPLKVSHRQIAGELGTAREVISRVMKKLENEGKIKQLENSIEIIGR